MICTKFKEKQHLSTVHVTVGRGPWTSRCTPDDQEKGKKKKEEKKKTRGPEIAPSRSESVLLCNEQGVSLFFSFFFPAQT